MKPSPAIIESPETPSRRSARTPKRKEDPEYVTPTKSKRACKGASLSSPASAPSARSASKSETPKKRRKIHDKKVEDDDLKTPVKTPRKASASRTATPAKIALVQLQTCDDQSIEQIMDISNMNYVSKRRKASSKPNLEDVAEVSTEDDDDDTRETLRMYGKYGKVMTDRATAAYGFATPKKNSMIERTNLVLSASKKTPISKALDRLTPRKSVPNSPTSNVRRALTPLSKLQLKGDAPETPKHVRTKLRVQIEKEAAESSSDDEEEESDGDSSENEDDLGVQPLKENLDTDNFFERQCTSQVITSDQTLSQLKTPRLSPEVLKSILDDEPVKYADKIKILCSKSRKNFQKWKYLMGQDFNLVLYGLGSKRALLNEFHQEMLANNDALVINGYFPSLSIKQVLSSIINDILELKNNIGTTLAEQADCILKAYNTMADDLYLVVHNIDGPMLRNESTQSIFAKLAGHPSIHLICSIDHINAPLLWDQHKLSNFNFIWQDATTFYPYSEETLNENSLMVRSGGGGLALHSLRRVFESLTPNAKDIYLLIVKYQMEAVDEQGFAFYQGFSFKDLYR